MSSCRCRGARTPCSVRGDENYNLMARLKPGVTMEQAKADVAAHRRTDRDKDKRDRTFTIDVVPLVESVVGNVTTGRAGARWFGGRSCCSFACANVANLLPHAANRRQKEVAGPHGAWRELASASWSASHRERAARPARRRCAGC
jgi:hypothetical protein